MSDPIARRDVPSEQTWDLSELFESREAWLAELAAIRNAVPTVTAFRGRLGASGAALLAALTADEEFLVRLSRAADWAFLRLAVDQGDPDRQADAMRAQQLATDVERERTFLVDEILALPEGTVPALSREEPDLERFARSLERILRDRPFRLSPETETALAAFGELFRAPHTLYERAAGADVRFEPVPDGEGHDHAVSVGRYLFAFAPSPDTRLRRGAAASIAAGFARYRNVLATALGTFVRSQVVEARLRGYDSTIGMDLHRQEVTRPVFDAVLDTISSGLAPHMRRYAAVQRRALGVEQAQVADLDAAWPGEAPTLPFEVGRERIIEAAEPMGAEYQDVIRRALTERWIDRADNAGRQGGAFCSLAYGTHPYVFATWTGTLRGAFMVAHELGHAVNFHLSMQHNPFNRSAPSLFASEAPSTFNELLLAQRLLAESDDPAYRRRVIKAHMATFNRNFVLHLQKAQLQRRIYQRVEQGESVTADMLDEEQQAVLEAFWGDSLELLPEDRTVWMVEAHYYAGLYPYTYAAGLSAAVAMFRAVQREGEDAVERWLGFLRAGGSRPPLELFERAGIDLTAPGTLLEAVDYVGTLIDELEGGVGPA